jgi:prevent-host-death family protein
MTTIGVRELKAHISEVLRRVHEQGETVDVTYRGEVIARLVPVQQSEIDTEASRKAWADLDRLAAEISTHWPEGVSALDAVHDVRREL